MGLEVDGIDQDPDRAPLAPPACDNDIIVTEMAVQRRDVEKPSTFIQMMPDALSSRIV
jgi:hypothetical protein